MDRAMEAGIDDVGCGVLYGLNNYTYDFVGMLMHAHHLEKTYGCGPHTISVPRIRQADDIDPETFDNGVPDDIFKRIVAVLSIAVPYTGMIMSTRESAKTRRECLEIGITQISGGSRTSVGGYGDDLDEDGGFDSEGTAQFDVEDRRTLGEVVDWLIDLGYVPSFCTACYREGRTGDRFMSLLKSGQIANCCQPNAMMTLKEFLIDYASEETKAKGDALIEEKLSLIPNEKVREICRQHLKEIENGNRDFRF
jgi:2-iminoacetate synthase